MKKIYILCFCCSLLFIPISAIHSTNMQVEVEPARFELQLFPNRSTTGAITVTNTSNRPSLFTAIPTTWDMTDQGEPIFSNILSADNSCANWITFNPRKFCLEAGKQQIVRFGVVPPSGCRSGEYRAAIQFQMHPLTGNQSTAGNIMVVVYSTFPEAQRNGRVVKNTVRYNQKQKTVTSILEVESLGTAHIRFDGTFVVKNLEGREVGTGSYNGSVVFAGKKRILNGYCRAKLLPGAYKVESLLKFEGPLYYPITSPLWLSEYPKNLKQLEARTELMIAGGKRE